ncbi:hypothetical protein PIB30_116803 [Stylosanthes scabra]|uniref:FAR1 domain-containing protein n=1 Tax=Stylosanthes scabra TaxID=79078 RepID=A0ABU6RRK6_9FABA|nr:hypothetical protein [Stylosanthes scabra]
MDNSSTKSTEDVDDTQDLSFEYECSSDESDNMAAGDVNMSEANAINIDGEEKLITDLQIEDIWGLVFDSESEVCDFYATYARCHGFVSRKDFKSVDVNDNINARQLVCNKARVRHWKYLEKENQQREHRAITRVNCEAKIRFSSDGRSGRWKVSAYGNSGLPA